MSRPHTVHGTRQRHGKPSCLFDCTTTLCSFNRHKSIKTKCLSFSFCFLSVLDRARNIDPQCTQTRLKSSRWHRLRRKPTSKRSDGKSKLKLRTAKRCQTKENFSMHTRNISNTSRDPAQGCTVQHNLRESPFLRSISGLLRLSKTRTNTGQNYPTHSGKNMALLQDAQ